jgi:hypothetical protein
LGNIAQERGDYNDAKASFDTAYMLYQQIDDREGIVVALRDLASLALARGEMKGEPNLAGQTRPSVAELDELFADATALDIAGDVLQRDP